MGGNLVVPLQTVEVNKVFGDDLLFRPSESFVEKKLKLDKKKNTTTSTDKTEIKTENSNSEPDNSENASGLENHEMNPWHTLLEKSSSYERLSRLDPATKPWV